MSKHFALIAFEIVLLAVLGFVTNLAAVELKINRAYVWIALILVLLLLILTTWFRVKLDSGNGWVGWRIAIPDKITFSISLSTIKHNFRFLLGLVINAALFGWLVANASIFAVRISPELDYTVQSAYFAFEIPSVVTPLTFEIIGIFAISFACIVIAKRLSLTTGFLFCIVSTLIFSVTHLNILPFQLVTWTILGNLISSLLTMIIGLLLYPIWRIALRQVTDFWRVPSKNRT